MFLRAHPTLLLPSKQRAKVKVNGNAWLIGETGSEVENFLVYSTDYSLNVCGILCLTVSMWNRAQWNKSNDVCEIAMIVRWRLRTVDLLAWSRYTAIAPEHAVVNWTRLKWTLQFAVHFPDGKLWDKKVNIFPYLELFMISGQSVGMWVSHKPDCRRLLVFTRTWLRYVRVYLLSQIRMSSVVSSRL